MLFDRTKLIVVLLAVGIPFFWVSSKVYKYFSYKAAPEFSFVGIEEGSSFKRNVNFAVKSDNGYKVSNVNLNLDGRDIDLGSSKWIGERTFEHKVSFDVTTVSDGLHKLEVTLVDSSYHANATCKKVNFYVDNAPLHAAFLEPEYKVYLGKTLKVKIHSNKKLKTAEAKFQSMTRPFWPESEESTVYEALIPIDCESAPGDFTVTAKLCDAVDNESQLTVRVQVLPFEFPKQKGFTVDSTKFKEDTRLGKTSKELYATLAKLNKESSNQKLWNGNFDFPMEVRKITTPFGEIRMTQERGRYMHHGVDLVFMPKNVIWAAQDGKIVLMDRFVFTGNTVVIDHGLGVLTLYAHLEDFADIKIGDMIKKGTPIGRVGMTGYSNGYHLHWEIRVNNVSIDPLEWVGKI